MAWKIIVKRRCSYCNADVPNDPDAWCSNHGVLCTRRPPYSYTTTVWIPD